jgi:hypothetical protein
MYTRLMGKGEMLSRVIRNSSCGVQRVRRAIIQKDTIPGPQLVIHPGYNGEIETS